MRLVRYGKPGCELPAIIDSQDRLRDVTSIIPDIDGAALSSSAWARLTGIQDVTTLPDIGSANEIRLGPCVGGVGKLICMGLNEKAHAREFKAGDTQAPIFFLKATSSITGALDPVIYPRVGRKLDWEAELAIVIGKRCKDVSRDAARGVIAGFCILNDLSDRHWQTDHTGRMTLVSLAKSFDTFAPLGPYLVTPDEIENPAGLSIKLWVNDQLKQDFNSADYIFDVYRTIEYCSQFMTLEAGDIISMGSGPGNGLFWNDYLQVGDRVTSTIDGLGVQEFSVVSETRPAAT